MIRYGRRSAEGLDGSAVLFAEKLCFSGGGRTDLAAMPPMGSTAEGGGRAATIERDPLGEAKLHRK